MCVQLVNYPIKFDTLDPTSKDQCICKLEEVGTKELGDRNTFEMCVIHLFRHDISVTLVLGFGLEVSTATIAVLAVNLGLGFDI